MCERGEEASVQRRGALSVVSWRAGEREQGGWSGGEERGEREEHREKGCSHREERADRKRRCVGADRGGSCVVGGVRVCECVREGQEAESSLGC